MEGKGKKRMLVVGLSCLVAGSLGGAAVASLPHTFIAGETLTADNLNTSLSSLDQRLTAIEQAHFPSAFRAYTEQAVAIGNPTVIAFDQVDFDLASEYNKTTGGFTAKQAGYYLVMCGFEFTPAANGYFAAVVFKNGTALSNEVGVSEFLLSAAPTHVTPQTTLLIQLVANDTLTCAGAQSSGTDQPAIGGFIGRNAFSAAKLF